MQLEIFITLSIVFVFTAFVHYKYKEALAINSRKQCTNFCIWSNSTERFTKSCSDCKDPDSDTYIAGTILVAFATAAFIALPVLILIVAAIVGFYKVGSALGSKIAARKALDSDTTV